MDIDPPKGGIPVELRVCGDIYCRACGELERLALPVFTLAVRVWVSLIFFRSGLQKMADWDATLFLFQEEYNLPILEPKLAAILATAFELGMPVMLVLGLAARISALPLLAITFVIQFVLASSNSTYLNVEHYYWIFLLSFIVIYGPGKLSMDYALRRVFIPDVTMFGRRFVWSDAGK